jgi:hypothetical protein
MTNDKGDPGRRTAGAGPIIPLHRGCPAPSFIPLLLGVSVVRPRVWGIIGYLSFVICHLSLLYSVAADPLFPGKTSLAITRASSLLLFTLDPEPPTKPRGKETFHDYLVGNEVIVAGADLEVVRDLLQRNCRPLKEATPGGAFVPSFGIRLVYDSKPYDFVLSYDSRKLRLWANDPDPVEYALTGNPNGLVEIFKSRGVPMRAAPTPNPLRKDHDN